MLSGRGSVFLRCERRAERYLPQPVHICPVFEPRARLRAHSPRGEAIVAWVGEPLAFDVRVTDGLLAFGPTAPPRPPDRVAPGDALIWRPEGIARSAEAIRGPVLGWVLAGRAAIFDLSDGAHLRFERVHCEASRSGE